MTCNHYVVHHLGLEGVTGVQVIFGRCMITVDQSSKKDH